MCAKVGGHDGQKARLAFHPSEELCDPAVLLPGRCVDRGVC